MSEFGDMPHLSLGKRVRLHRLMYSHGPGNGRMLILPIDQGLEHGPSDFFSNPESGDPDFQFRLAEAAGFSGIALHIGLIEKYALPYAGRVPVVVKINGKTRIPSEDSPFSPLTASVRDAVRVGADAIGYTLYVGSANQHLDIDQFRRVRSEANSLGMPVFLWAYPRGAAVELRGGRDSLFAVEYAARVACELGADAVKLNIPTDDPKTRAMQPPPYDKLQLDLASMIRRVVRSAGRTKVLFSGGGMIDDALLLERAKICIEQGATGFIIGRNIWQRNWEDALRIANQIKRIVQSA